jgi:hypothetical protein
MVTHRTANFIMLISNLPSVRSSRFKPNVGSRVIRLSLSFPFSLFFFSFYSHTMSFFCQIRSSSFASHICTATKTTTTMTMKTTIFSFVFFFSFLHIDTYIRFIRSPSGERRKGSYLCHYGN